MKRRSATVGSESEVRRHRRRLYQLMEELERRLGGARTLINCDARMGWPERGVYFFFEPRELRGDGSGRLRIVRVGTHALKRGARSRFWGRLRQHRGSGRLGEVHGGNHRGSIFRHHVGLALIASGHFRDADVEAIWRERRRAPREGRQLEAPLEREVSQVVGRMPFLWVDVPDTPGPDSERGMIEANLIGLLSAAVELDPPSRGWFGRRAEAPQIKRSGLWNVNHVDSRYDPEVLDLLESKLP